MNASGYLLRLLSVSVAILVLCGCTSGNQNDLATDVTLTLNPSPPVVGTSSVSLILSRPDGSPVKGATVRLEGNMNHAGMKPSFADLAEGEPGQYAGTLEFTMGGDWFVIVTATTADGRRIEQKIDVRGVKTQ